MATSRPLLQFCRSQHPCTLKKLEKPVETSQARRDLPPICLPFKVVVDPMSCGVDDDDDDDAGAMQSFSCIWLHISALLPPNPISQPRALPANYYIY
ncbi:hypothetical protein PGT21_003645 [Puccinia graminis f. sp. tritici]|uniref:Uncharacterized protein n=1 Tax=Puccinia graminis f. sp. tritici TaxID=56615 RepID=A0A5B0SJR6_PUCGR|nr:hypothetical protein PGT21_003645 [Puccinia graminis f. sp. tritici]KAA1137835.1 hypothetical protein PGTUg99_023625 [Puccinia graminis f. sp. tritici]